MSTADVAYSRFPFLGPGIFDRFNSPTGIHASPTSHVVAYVRSSGIQEGDPEQLDLVPSIEHAVARTRAGRGDIIVVLPGHVETISAAGAWAGLAADARVVGSSSNIFSASAPTVNFTTATTAQIVLASSGIQLANLVFDLTGIDAVAAGINPDAAGIQITNCRFLTNDAAGQVVIGILIDNVAADNFVFAKNWVEGTAADPAVGAFIDVSAAVAGVKILDNVMIAGMEANTGFVDLAAAATQVFIANNYMFNLTAASDTCILVGNVATQGLVVGNRLGHTTGTAGTSGIELGAANILRLIDNLHISEDDLSGVLTPVAT